MDNYGFASTSGLREINIGHEDKPRPMCASAKLDPEYKARVDKFIKGCFA